MPERAYRIGVIHTSPATVELFGRLLRERIPGAALANLLDDSILPELRDNGGDIEAVASRFNDYVRIVSERGVDVVLNACSSIGALCERARDGKGRPVVRVDEAMAEAAVARGPRVAVLATLSTTLGPTGALVRAAAARAGRGASVETELVAGAYEALMAGDQAGHDAAIRAVIERRASVDDVVVLAQASMARAAAGLDEALVAKLVTSPSYAVEAVALRLGV